MLELNEIYNEDCLETMKRMADNSVDLIIADPPYFKVINEEWDFQWRTEEDYINWCVKWFKEMYRVLRVGGSVYIYGYFRILANLLTHLENLGFELRQQIVLDKGMRAVSGRATKNYKMFPNVTESLMFLTKDNKPFTRNLLKRKQKESGLTAREINEGMGVKSNGGGMWSIYTGKNISKQFPTSERWGKLQEILEFDYPYEELSITFNAQMGLTDVWDDINFYEEERNHPTQKPLKLSDRLIKASSNERDIVYIPFAGSGSEVISCIKNNRNYIASEISSEYIEEIIQPRLKELQ